MFGIRYRTKYVNKFNKGDLDCQSNQAFEILENRMGPMDFIYDNFYDRWRSCTISYTFGTLPDRIGAFRYISAITSCDSMPQYCCVPGCTNYGGHVFPSDPELKKKWSVVIKRLDEKSRDLWTPGKYDVVCTVHFRESDYKETLSG